MEGKYDGNVFDLLELNDPRVKLVFGAKLLGREEVYTDIKKIEMEIGCYATFDTLLTEFCTAVLDQVQALKTGKSLSLKSAQVLRLLGDHAPTSKNAPAGGWNSYQCLRRVIDYVTGMTDNYATYISRQFQGAGFSGVQRP